MTDSVIYNIGDTRLYHLTDGTSTRDTWPMRVLSLCNKSVLSDDAYFTGQEEYYVGFFICKECKLLLEISRL